MVGAAPLLCWLCILGEVDGRWYEYPESMEMVWSSSGNGLTPSNNATCSFILLLLPPCRFLLMHGCQVWDVMHHWIQVQAFENFAQECVGGVMDMGAYSWVEGM